METREMEANTDSVPQACKSRLMSWRLVGAVLAFLVVLGWIFIIVVLILEEKWQLVLVAWLLLYSAAHFCYWYCKRHSLITLHRQIRLRVLTNMSPGGESSGLKVEDLPPTYDEVVSTEAPPPAYFTVVSEKTPPSVDYPQVHVTPAKEYLERPPPEYRTPKNLRKLSPRILPRAPTDAGAASLTVATVAAAAAAVATVAQPNGPAEDPIRDPIVKHLRSTTMATLEVSSEEEVVPEPSTSSEVDLR